jgi:Ca-activated chloride channel family protein
MKTSLTQLLRISALLAASWLPASGEVLRLSTTPEKEAVLRKPGTEVVIKIDLDARPAEKTEALPLNLTFVLDWSSSMRGDKLEPAKQAVYAVLDRLTLTERVSAVHYDSEVKPVFYTCEN